jgi:hypothetical protein
MSTYVAFRTVSTHERYHSDQPLQLDSCAGQARSTKRPISRATSKLYPTRQAHIFGAISLLQGGLEDIRVLHVRVERDVLGRVVKLAIDEKSSAPKPNVEPRTHASITVPSKNRQGGKI